MTYAIIAAVVVIILAISITRLWLRNIALERELAELKRVYLSTGQLMPDRARRAGL